MTKFELHIPITDKESTKSIIDILSEQKEIHSLALSKSILKQAITKGALWLTKGKYTQRLRRIKKKLKTGDELHFYYNEAILSQQPTPAKLIADLTDYSIWYKPYGMLAQGSKWSDHCSISRWAQTQLTPERSVFIVHRLDRAATGLIMLAHTKKAARALSEMFENRTDDNALEKYYQIIVHGNHNMRLQPDVITQNIDTKKSRSTFLCQNYHQAQNISLIQVKIDSGRKHQIRLHAKSIGMPVVGDRLHGLNDIQYAESLHLQLCAYALRFICPLTQEKRNFTLSPEDTPNLIKTAELLSL